MTDAFIYDAVRTPRGKGRKDGSLHEVTPVRLAVTALKAKGIPLVIAGSFSQTYLRNAFNNGFLCIEAPELVTRLLKKFAQSIVAREKTIISGEVIEEVRRGYYWKNSVFRYAQVRVAK